MSWHPTATTLTEQQLTILRNFAGGDGPTCDVCETVDTYAASATYDEEMATDNEALADVCDHLAECAECLAGILRNSARPQVEQRIHAWADKTGFSLSEDMSNVYGIDQYYLAERGDHPCEGCEDICTGEDHCVNEDMCVAWQRFMSGDSDE